MSALSIPSRRRRNARPRSLGELLAQLGRLALWLAVAVVLLRGVADLLASGRPARSPRVERAAGPAWPDDAARAVAAEFVSAYLTHAPTDEPDAHARALAEFASPELAGALAPRVEDRGPRQRVRSAAVADVTALDGRHALVTVAATVAGEGVRNVRVTVPIARDARGGLAVYDLPSLAPAPARANAGPISGDPLLGPERAAIADVLTRFFRAYLAGDAGGLAYLVPAGTRIGAAAGGFELVELASVTAAGPASADGRTVLATVNARDRVSRAVLALRYRVRLGRRDRWYVADLNDTNRR